MDHFAKVNEPGYGTPVCGLIIGGLLTYFFGTYALSNPDAATCWSTPDGVTSGVFVDDSQTDVTANFHAYFLIQFISSLIGLGIGVFQLIGTVASRPALYRFGGFINGVLLCLSFAMLIVGSVFRWRIAGRACSGDTYAAEVDAEGNAVATPDYFLVSSGNFINAWLIIQYCFIGLACCSLGLFCIVAACKASS